MTVTRPDFFVHLIKQNLFLDEIEQVIKDLEEYKNKQVEEKELCPHCYYHMEYGGFTWEKTGYMGNAPAYQELPTVMFCDQCNYVEDI